VKLCKPVYGLFEVRWVWMVNSIPFSVLVGLLQAKIGADVDDLHSLLQHRDAGLGAGLVRQGREN